jgi:hypothetical protein
MSLAKFLLLLVFVAILGSLASGLFYLFKDDSSSKRTVKALTWRIGLSVGLFILLFIAWASGLIEPGRL